MVDLPDPDEPTKRGHLARLGAEAHIEQHRLAGFVREVDVLELDGPLNGADGHRAVRILILGLFTQHFAGAIETGEGLRELRADSDRLEHRRDQKRQKRDERQEIRQSEVTRENLAGAHVPHQRADDSHQHRGGEAHHRHHGERPEYVVQQPLDAGRKHVASRSSA